MQLCHRYDWEVRFKLSVFSGLQSTLIVPTATSHWLFLTLRLHSFVFRSTANKVDLAKYTSKKGDIYCDNLFIVDDIWYPTTKKVTIFVTILDERRQVVVYARTMTTIKKCFGNLVT